MSDLPFCPWFKEQDNAAYVAQSVLRLLTNSDSYADDEIIKLASLAGRFSYEFGDGIQSKNEWMGDSQFISSLLRKMSMRGCPAPCSVSLERKVLEEARLEGILEYSEECGSGAILFEIRPLVNGLESMLMACFFKELLVDDETINGLLERYRSMCTGPEKKFFNRIIELFGERRLGLNIIPQRKISTMYAKGFESERVDFAIELPRISGEGYLRIVIEIDDSSHDGTQSAHDKARDRALKKAGWEVIRLRLKDEASWDRHIGNLVENVLECIPGAVLASSRRLRLMDPGKKDAITSLVWNPIAEAQLTVAVALCLHNTTYKQLTLSGELEKGFDGVICAVNELIGQISTIHQIGPIQLSLSKESVLIEYHHQHSMEDWEPKRENCARIFPIIGGLVGKPPIVPVRPRPVKDAKLDRLRPSLKYFLQNLFRKVDFRPGQLEIISRALKMDPVIGLLPTAAGKSITYQLPSLLQPGMVVVVDPLVSLIVDQSSNLASAGIHRTISIVGGENRSKLDATVRDEALDSMIEGRGLFIFIAPERLQIPSFNDAVRSWTTVPIPYLVIDEAHCISEWGHDFRPAYLNIRKRAEAFARAADCEMGIIALTGTASRNVLIDIVNELGTSNESIIEPSSFDRPELNFEVIQCHGKDRLLVLGKCLTAVAHQYGWRIEDVWVPSGLVFTNYARGNNGVIKMRDVVAEQLQINVGIFSGKNPTNNSDDDEWKRQKKRTQDNFKKDIYPILACTNSFGMGIDKPTIRFTINTMLPQSLEEFYQEAGRAGRDKKHSTCIIIFSDEHPEIANELLDTERTSFDQIIKKTSGIPSFEMGDAIRNTWFLTNSYIGADQEKILLERMINWMLDVSGYELNQSSSILEIPFSLQYFDLSSFAGDNGIFDSDKKTVTLEKMLLRLSILGLVKEYLRIHKEKCS